MGPRTSVVALWHIILTISSLCLLLVVVAPSPALAYTELSDAALRSVPGGADVLHPHTGSLLTPILIPRVPGTPGSIAVQNHFVAFFARELPLWRLEWHNSTSRTPATGDAEVPFANLVFTRDPPWTKGNGDVGRLALVAHYDSLYKPDGFIGAIDSAAPCAMLMHVAKSIDAVLTKKWAAMEASGDVGMGLEEDEKGVQILFLDGEEAWESWSDTDSLYGARALAEKWEAESHPAQSTYKTPLESINLFVLLDLLGAANPTVPSYFPSTHWAYQGMAKIERRMRDLGLLATKPKRLFLPESKKAPERFISHSYIADDHVPFMMRGVPVLHLIPTPFPLTWHTLDDDADHLDLDSIVDWAKIVTAFTAEWLDLGEFMGHGTEETEEIRQRSEL